MQRKVEAVRGAKLIQLIGTLEGEPSAINVQLIALAREVLDVVVLEFDGRKELPPSLLVFRHQHEAAGVEALGEVAFHVGLDVAAVEEESGDLILPGINFYRPFG